jgi:Domain of unknown function (DUF4372)
VREFSCADQFRCLSFAPLTYRRSLRDIEACPRAQGLKLYHLGIRRSIARSTLADANETRDWRIYAEFVQHVIGVARRLYVDARTTSMLGVLIAEASAFYVLDRGYLDFERLHRVRDAGAFFRHARQAEK